MNIPAKLYPLVDQLYDYFTIKRKCSVALTNDLFDNRSYSINEFYNNVQPFFNKPELFYTALTAPSEEEILALNPTINDETVFTYPSPAITNWNENNYFLKMKTRKRCFCLHRAGQEKIWMQNQLFAGSF